jgi:hypothetical protein
LPQPPPESPLLSFSSSSSSSLASTSELSLKREILSANDVEDPSLRRDFAAEASEMPSLSSASAPNTFQKVEPSPELLISGDEYLEGYEDPEEGVFEGDEDYWGFCPQCQQDPSELFYRVNTLREQIHLLRQNQEAIQFAEIEVKVALDFIAK